MQLIDADHFKQRVMPKCKFPDSLEFEVDSEPTVDAVPISVIKRGIKGFSAAISCDQGGSYSVTMCNALKRVLEWYGSPDYKQTEAVACGKTVVNQYGKENYHIDHVDELFL